MVDELEFANSSAPAESELPELSPQDFKPETFDPHLNTRFRVQCHSGQCDEFDHLILDHAGEVVELELVEVTRYEKLRELEGGFEGRPREPFALLFRGNESQPILSAVHDVTHETLGRMHLFLSPVQVFEAPKEGETFRPVFFESTFS